MSKRWQIGWVPSDTAGHQGSWLLGTRLKREEDYPHHLGNIFLSTSPHLPNIPIPSLQLLVTSILEAQPLSGGSSKWFSQQIVLSLILVSVTTYLKPRDFISEAGLYFEQFQPQPLSVYLLILCFSANHSSHFSCIPGNFSSVLSFCVIKQRDPAHFSYIS